MGFNGEVEEFGNQIKCPYCKHEETDSWEWEELRHSDDTTEHECEECGKNFNITLSISYEYTTKGLCKKNNEEHKWDYFDHIREDNEERCFGRKCLVCGDYEFNVEKPDEELKE